MEGQRAPRPNQFSPSSSHVVLRDQTQAVCLYPMNHRAGTGQRQPLLFASGKSSVLMK